MGVLLVLDRHALAAAYQSIVASEQQAILKWLIHLVESKLIRLYYYDSSLPNKEDGCLLDLANWAYSYPLALFSLAELERLEGNNESFQTYRDKADGFLTEAMLRFPSVIPLLLQNLEIDTSGRSFQRDWVGVLDFAESRARHLKRQWQADCDDVVNLSATLQTMERINKIFVLNPSKQWVEENAIQWFFHRLQALSTSDSELPHKQPSSPSIMRYSNVKLSDFEARHELLPEDANIIDPNVVAQVMAPMQPGRQRFLRRQQQQQRDIGALNGANGAHQPPALLGPPRNAIDLDWPMAEVFWRAFLPWNYVEGLPPPRR
jgi:Transcriptional repressor TCF25